MCVLSVGDEVTNTLIKESGRPILEDGVVSFFYEVAEGIFVLRNNLRYTWDVGVNNGEIEGYCHKGAKIKNTEKESRW